VAKLDASELLTTPSPVLVYIVEWHHSTVARQELLRRLTAGEAAVAEAARLKAALQEAITLAEEGWGYAGDYFRTKWGYAGQIAALKAALEGSDESD